ncbi:MAG: serine hydroxymethyltransferase [Leptotrichiaceae bacterium]|nr:serine hydroxymethyltransferase [Leptotrichiaceae bacterium]MBP7101117.1 serine hydroxymethyltransferase [Leptotrichiaceae bacterium]MBP7725402.1 serine hydroxymethyltransferase [Leptotrichiaceae bacterium]MBP9630498.1 serine hydroxymethyltransferase [Leptotrichiaceae bacterium]
MSYIKDVDIDVYNAIVEEEKRQEEGIELIASENFVSKAVMEAAGSVFTNKYAEGYPGKRYYGGCVNADIVENIAIERLKKLFGAKYVNVQAHSGSQANMGVYVGLLDAGDKILGMSLNAGGHLTHGYKINFSGKNYIGLEYGLNSETELIDYEEIRKQALEEKPKIIVAGASAYSRIIDFKKFREIADEVGAYLMVDMAHIAGLIAAGEHPNPIEYADVVTSTTHKTLRGPRGGIILTNNEEIAKKIDRTIFPGIQGGPLMHIIAAKAVAFKEALAPEYKEYQKQVVKNAKAMSEELISGGLRIVSGGTDNHLMLVDLRPKKVTGKLAEEILEKAGITCNKNAIPNDPEKPFVTSGVRLGTPAITARGMKENEARIIAKMIIKVLENANDENKINEVKSEILELTKKFPLYKGK